jgi:YVTN family beta-propeller protein
LAVGACNQSTSPTKLKASYDGTMAISTDGKLLYTANADTGTMTVVDASQKQVVATVTVGSSPARIVVGPDDTIYVSNQGSRAISVIHRGTWSQAASINVGAEPVGLALSADASTLYVANSASGTVDAIDVTSPAFTQKWEATLGDLPRGVAVLPNGSLYVTHYKTAFVDVLDGASGNVTNSISTTVGVDANSAGASVGTLSPVPTFRSVGLDSIVVSPDGASAYLVHRRDRIGVLQPGSANTPVVVPALTTIDLASSAARNDASDANKNFPPPVIFPGPNFQSSSSGLKGIDELGPTPSTGIEDPSDGETFSSGGGNGGGGGSSSYGAQEAFGGAPWTQGPVAAVEDPAAQFLYVANVNSDNVTVLSPTDRTALGADNGIVGLVSVGFAPSGLALSQDAKTLYVHNSLDYSISVVQRSGSSMVEVARITVSSPGALTSDVVQGRQLFFSASNAAMTIPGGGVACESCHLSGGSDGNVWQFPFGPRKTPSLFGRKIQDTAPYHWDGTETDFNAFFAETVQVRMGGTGVSSQQISQITTYLQGLGTPDNPFRQVGGGLTAAQQSGQALFAGKAGCIACHTGENFTDNSFHDVGTFVTSNPNGQPDDACRLNPSLGLCASDTPAGITANPNNLANGFNTPSLLGVVWAAPYLHSGSALTLTDRILDNPGNVHGNTATLTSDEVDDLVQYLQTL